MTLHRFARNTLFSTIAGCSTAGGSFVASVIVARLLGPAGAGAVALALWIVATAVTAGDLGIPLTLARFGPDLFARGEEAAAVALARGLLPALLATTVGGVALALAAFSLEWTPVARALPFAGLPSTVWLAIAGVFAAQALGSAVLGRLRGEQRFADTARLAVVSAVLQVGAVAGGSLLFGVVGGLAGFAAGSLVPALRLLRRPPDRAPPLDPTLRRRAWRFALHSWGAGLVSTIVWSRSELAFLGYWRGAEEAGYYTVALTLSQMAIQAPLLMTGGLLALFSERQGASDIAGLARAYAGALRFMAAALLPASFGMAALVPVLVPAAFGPAFGGAVPATIALVAMGGVGALSTVSTMYLFAVEQGRFVVRVGLFGAAALCIAGVTVIPAFGIWGTVAARVAIQLGLTAAAFLFIERRCGAAAPWAGLARIAGAAIGSGAAAFAVTTILPTGLAIPAGIAAGVATYLVLVKALRALSADDATQALALAGRLPVRVRRRATATIAWMTTMRPADPDVRSAASAQGVAGG